MFGFISMKGCRLIAFIYWTIHGYITGWHRACAKINVCTRGLVHVSGHAIAPGWIRIYFALWWQWKHTWSALLPTSCDTICIQTWMSQQVCVFKAVVENFILWISSSIELMYIPLFALFHTGLTLVIHVNKLNLLSMFDLSQRSHIAYAAEIMLVVFHS